MRFMPKLPINLTINVHVHATQSTQPAPQPQTTLCGDVRIGNTGRPWIQLPRLSYLDAGHYHITLSRL
jgi:hypothetical protein